MKNTDTPSIERAYQEWMADFTPGPKGSVHSLEIFEAGWTAAIATLETLPSAGEGVERPPSGYTKLPDGMICKCISLWTHEDGSHWCCQAGNVGQALTPSPPLEQPDIEGRARELLARFHESGGNKAAAFTVRKVGPTGIVLEAQHAVLVYALSIPTTEIRREANWCFDMEAAPRNCLVLDGRWGVTEALRFDDGTWGLATFNGQIMRASPVAWQPKPAAPGEPSPPSRPSFDKWDYARDVLADARCAK